MIKRENLKSIYAGRAMVKASKNISKGIKNGSSIVNEVSAIARIERKDVSMIYRLILKNIADSLVKGKGVRLTGVCTFHIQKQKAKISRTGFRRPIQSKHDERFKPGTKIILPEKMVVKGVVEKDVKEKVVKAFAERKEVIIDDNGTAMTCKVAVQMPFGLKKAVWNAAIERKDVPPAIRVLASDPSIALPNDVPKFK